MRLTCPNCGAQYEVPDDVIPEDGRDVQCSNCGTTWFQTHPSAAALAEGGLRRSIDPLPDEDGDGDGDDIPPPPPRSEAPARSVTPDAADILRQEAEYEARMRREEAGGIETQPDLGLDEAADDIERRARQARERMARLKGPGAAVAAQPAVETAPVPPGSRRDRLADIDEINSSLRARAEPAERPTETDPTKTVPRRSGFARGFSVSLIVVVLGVLAYANAPLVSATVPQADPALNAYVVFIDGLRLQLDALVQPYLP
ncbi:MAG: zinc-ribbon domain-containing protein [Proteobacteria bacterium]|nr:zinc-ribbon domain-containing protein [Pseudomonadota bacterium]